MPQSLEHSKHFHLARRIARIVAPDFRVFTTEAIKEKEYVLDLKSKTIEIGEKTRDFEAVGAILFCVGQLRIKKSGQYPEHFGNLSLISSQDEALIIGILSAQGEKVDRLASAWALEVFVSNWNVSVERAASIFESLTWNASEWDEFYRTDASAV
jgi:hypothetical protein